ncbi:esterase OVCA2-like [Sycon ciliatum]|uniref:esterase OVCA2-like n=1 Tax=Sycon ciliatum TaxID=27933 RepID=UPI0031F65689
MASPERKLKILCLHGYRQCGVTFRERTGALRKMLKSMAEFVFVTAPHAIPGSEDLEIGKQYGWWFSDSSCYDCNAETCVDIGFDDSVEFLRRVLKEQGPFDGVLAFSQGASFLGMLCRMQMSEPEVFNFKFVLLVAGFRSLQEAHQRYYSAAKMTIPSLHMIGDTDKVIVSSRSDEFAEMFENPDIIRHPGGHFIAASSAQKDGFKSFLKRFV